MSMQMISQKEETEAQVTWEDQSCINRFSKNNIKYEKLEQIYNEKKTEIEYLQDLSSELELADEDDMIK
jgi:prefoldin subunit 4